MNHDKKVSFIWVVEYGSPARSLEFMKTWNKVNIILQTTGGDAYSLKGKVKVLIINLLISQELFYWTQVTINTFDVLPISMPYWSPAELRIDCVVVFLTSYVLEQDLHTRHNKIWGVIVYIINKRVTRNNIDDRSHHYYFMGYVDTTGVIIYWNPYQHFFNPQSPSCLVWWIYFSSLCIRQAHSRLFNISTRYWNSCS